MTGTAPIRSSVAWLTAYECVCCPCGEGNPGLRLTEPLLRTIVGGEGAEFVVTTKVFGGGSVWLPLANEVIAAVEGCMWRDGGAEPGAMTSALWLCPVFGPWPCP